MMKLVQINGLFLKVRVRQHGGWENNILPEFGEYSVMTPPLQPAISLM